MNYQELVEELSKVAAQIATTTTLKTIEEQRQADAKAIKDRRIHNTKLLLRKYRLFNEHIGSSTFKESQINLAMAIDFSQEMYDPGNRADQAGCLPLGAAFAGSGKNHGSVCRLRRFNDLLRMHSARETQHIWVVP